MSHERLNVKTLDQLALELLELPRKKQLVALALIASGAANADGATLKARELSLLIYRRRKHKVLPSEIVEIVREFELFGFLVLNRLNDGRACVTLKQQISSNKNLVHVREIDIEHCASCTLLYEQCAEANAQCEKKKKEKRSGVKDGGCGGKPSGGIHEIAPCPTCRCEPCPVCGFEPKQSPVPKQIAFDGSETDVLDPRVEQHQRAVRVTKRLIGLYRETSGRKRIRILKRRISMVNARLAEGYEPIDLARAIYGVCYSPFHRENGYDKFDIALRSGEQIEKLCIAWEIHAPIEEVIAYQDKTGETVACRAEDIRRHQRKQAMDERFHERLAIAEREAEKRAAEKAAQDRLDEEATEAALEQLAKCMAEGKQIDA